LPVFVPLLVVLHFFALRYFPDFVLRDWEVVLEMRYIVLQFHSVLELLDFQGLPDFDHIGP
jgi:hypothetical protein